MYGSCEHKVAGHETSSCWERKSFYISHALSSIFMRKKMTFWQVLNWLIDLKNLKLHTVSLQVFHSLSFSVTLTWTGFFFREITIFISRLLLNDFFSGSMLKKAPIYYATVCESVFRIISRILDRKFESVETSSGFAQLLGENWGFQVISEKKY